MIDDDQLFLRCLIVAATATGCVVSALYLAPVGTFGDGAPDAWTDGAPGKVRRATVAFAFPSAGRRPMVFPERNGGAPAAAAGIPVQPSAGMGARPAGAQVRRRGAGSALDPERGASAVATFSEVPSLGADAAPLRPGDIAPLRSPTAWPLQVPDVMPPQRDMSPVQITVQRGGRRLGVDAGLSTQDMDDDPLPEFHRFLARAHACAMEVARRDAPVVGKVVLAFTVTPSGMARDAHVTGGSVTDPQMRGCLKNALEARRYFDARDEELRAERVVLFAH